MAGGLVRPLSNGMVNRAGPLQRPRDSTIADLVGAEGLAALGIDAFAGFGTILAAPAPKISASSDTSGPDRPAIAYYDLAGS